MTNIETHCKKANEVSGDNVAIFIDYDNIYHSLRDFGADIESKEADVIDFLWKCYGRDKIRSFKAYADFAQVEVDLRKLQLNRVQIKQVYGNGKGEKFRKNASDIELSIDALEATYQSPEIDTYVFVTADSDMIPIMSRMTFKAKKVHLYYMGTNVSQYQDITKYSHHHEDLLNVFEIDLSRMGAPYWKEKVLSHIKNWYLDPKNSKAMYGGTWLRDGLIKEFKFSNELTSKIIQYLEVDGSIVKFKIQNTNKEGYIIKEDILQFEGKFGENAIRTVKSVVNS